MSTVLFDFSQPDAVNAWRAIDDRVMGGVSHSVLRPVPLGYACFEGLVSLDRNGGFASVRSSPGNRGRPGATRCLLEVRGPAKVFKISFITDNAFDSVHYQADFTPAGGDWQTLSLALADFRPRFRGREVPGAPPLDPAGIRQVGLMIAARQAGPFALDIRRICLE